MSSNQPLVGIVMGSDSDWPKINGVAKALEEFGVPYEARVMSAHRTPQIVHEYATSASSRGLKVVIAAAGGAAHLAGVVASHTTLPVIGIPVATDLSQMMPDGDGQVALLCLLVGGHDPPDAGGIGGDGFLHEGMLAGRDSRLELHGPEPRRRTQEHQVNVAGHDRLE